MEILSSKTTKTSQRTTPASLLKHLEALSEVCPERVRWFYFENKKWSPFCGRDSLRIEHCFRRLPMQKNDKKMLPDVYELCSVLGGLYDADVVKRICEPVYWKGDPLKICRGTWFKGSISETKWTPISEEESLKIEDSHQMLWKSIGITPGMHKGDENKDPTTTVNPEIKSVLCRLQLSGCYIEWTDLNEVWLHSEGVKSTLIRGVVQKIGGSTGEPLHRGYHTKCVETDAPADVTHLIFVIHGAGQLVFNSINKSCQVLRRTSKTIAEKYYNEKDSKGRVEFVPVEWRSSLKLDGGVINLVTPHSMRDLRNVINTTMMDVMYYSSPVYREEMILFVKDELNRLYNLFLSRQPSFRVNGKVSIIAHSLGSVIVHDILREWESKLCNFKTYPQNSLNTVYPHCSSELNDGLLSHDKTDNPIDDELAQTMQQNENTNESLLFKVTYLFMIGSPLAVFFSLRGFRPSKDTKNEVLPHIVCGRWFNIYDQCDPVAYRLEPLFCERYSNIEPVHIKSHIDANYSYDSPEGPLLPDKSLASGNWLVYALFGRYVGGDNQGGARDAEDTDFIDSDAKGVTEASKSGWFSSIFSRSKTNDKNSPNKDLLDGKDDNTESKKLKKVLPRIDFILSDNKSQYWSVVTSHYSYWQSTDFCRFVLHHVYFEDETEHS